MGSRNLPRRPIFDKAARSAYTLGALSLCALVETKVSGRPLVGVVTMEGLHMFSIGSAL